MIFSCILGALGFGLASGTGNAIAQGVGGNWIASAAEKGFGSALEKIKGDQNHHFYRLVLDSATKTFTDLHAAESMRTGGTQETHRLRCCMQLSQRAALVVGDDQRNLDEALARALFTGSRADFDATVSERVLPFLRDISDPDKDALITDIIRNFWKNFAELSNTPAHQQGYQSLVRLSLCELHSDRAQQRLAAGQQQILDGIADGKTQVVLNTDINHLGGQLTDIKEILTTGITDIRSDIAGLRGWVLSVTTNLPPKNGAFVGRADDLQKLREALETHHAVAIVAGAGFGKTELAKELAHQTQTEWKGTWWLDGSKTGEERSLTALFETLTGQESPRMPDPVEGEDREIVRGKWLRILRNSVRERLSTGNHLLVLDNAETEEQIRQYRLQGTARLVATTRRQPIARAVAQTYDLDLLSAEDARKLLTADRQDLLDPRFELDLDAIAEHLGRHALALGYAAAILRKRRLSTPQNVLAQMKATDIGAEGDLFADFTEDSLGTEYRHGLAQSLTLLLEELPADGLAIEIARLAAYCDSAAVPIAIFDYACPQSQSEIDDALYALEERSILQIETHAVGRGTVTIHRLTQSALRSRQRSAQDRDPAERPISASPLTRLLKGLVSIYEKDDRYDLYKLRTACLNHCDRYFVFAREQDRDVEASLRHLRSKHYLVLGQLSSADEDIEIAISWGKKQEVRDDRSLAIWYASRASIRRLRGDLLGAEADIEKAISWEVKQESPDEMELAIRYATRASIRQYWGNLQGAEEDIEKSIAWGEKQEVRDDRSLAIDYATRASIRRDRENLSGAAEDIGKSIAYGEEQEVRDERGLAIWYATRASIRRNQSDLPGAEADIEKAIEWGEKQQVRDDRSLAIRYATRASIRQYRGNFQGAEEDIEKSIAWGEKQKLRDDRSLAIDYATRASIRRDRGNLQGAEADIASALTYYRTHLPGDKRSIGIMEEIEASLRIVRIKG